MESTSIVPVIVESGGDQVVGHVGLGALGDFADRMASVGTTEEAKVKAMGISHQVGFGERRTVASKTPQLGEFGLNFVGDPLLFAFRRQFVDELDLRYTAFEIETEITAHAVPFGPPA